MEPGDIPQQVVEAGTGDPAGGVHVDAVEGFHDLGVIGNLEAGRHGLAKALHLHVGRVVGANGHTGIDDIGDDQHDFADLLRQLSLPLLQGGQPVGVGLDLCLEGLGPGQLGGILFGLAHQDTHLFGLGVAGSAQVLGGLDGVPVLTVQLQHPVHQGQLLVLEFLADVFLYGLGIFPDEFDIEHIVSPHIVWYFSSASRPDCDRRPGDHRWPDPPRSWRRRSFPALPPDRYRMPAVPGPPGSVPGCTRRGSG